MIFSRRWRVNNRETEHKKIIWKIFSKVAKCGYQSWIERGENNTKKYINTNIYRNIKFECTLSLLSVIIILFYWCWECVVVTRILTSSFNVNFAFFFWEFILRIFKRRFCCMSVECTTTKKKNLSLTALCHKIQRFTHWNK